MSGQKIFEKFIDQYFLNHWGVLVYASATGWLALNIVTTYFPSAPKITNFPNKEKKERGLIEKTVAIVASVIVFGGGVILVSRLLTMQKELTEAETKLSQTKELTNVETKLFETNGELTKAETKLFETNGELTNVETKLFETNGELTKAETKLSETNGELTKAETKLSETNGELTKLTKAETQIQGLVDQIHTVFHDTLKCWSPSVALVRNDTNAVVKVHVWHRHDLSVAGKVYEVPPNRFQVVEGNGLSRWLGQGLKVRVANGPIICVCHNEICTVSELSKRES
jgi:cell division protein FtsL